MLSKDLMAEIDEILKDDDLDSSEKDVTFVSSSHCQTLKNKCSVVHLGGTQSEVGITTNSVTRACDRLKCVACDNPVLLFNNFSWTRSPDYLFLRTNYPNYNLLKCKLRKSTGTRAYCCQCNAIDTGKLVALAKYTNLQWICTRHPE
ncbi:unnamed protein product [Trichobilharzia szidati]|nr:unnamed protein product [Trichobilharzia szidati]